MARPAINPAGLMPRPRSIESVPRLGVRLPRGGDVAELAARERPVELAVGAALHAGRGIAVAHAPGDEHGGTGSGDGVSRLSIPRLAPRECRRTPAGAGPSL